MDINSRIVCWETDLTVPKGDRVACAAASNKFLVLGMISGYLHILSLGGHHCASVFLDGCCPVQVAVFPDDKVLVASHDNRVLIIEPWTPLIVSEYPLARAQAITALHVPPPNSSLTYIVAAEDSEKSQLLVASSNIFGFSRIVSTPLPRSVAELSCGTGFWAWACQDVLQIADASSRAVLFSMDRPQPRSPRGKPTQLQVPGMFHVQLQRIGENRLVIGWADAVQTLELGQGRVKLVSSFQLEDFWLVGFAAREHFLVVAAVEKGEKDQWNSTSVLVCDLQGNILDQQKVDIGSGTFRLSEVFFRACMGTNLEEQDVAYFVVCPHRVVAVKLRDAEQVVRELLGKGLVEQALCVADKHQFALTEFSFPGLVEQCFQHFVASKQLEKASDVCLEYARDSKHLWSVFLDTLCEHSFVSRVCLAVPLQKPFLETLLYTRVLLVLLEEDVDLLEQCLGLWPTACYDVRLMLESVRREHDRVGDSRLTRCLSHLSLGSRRPSAVLQAFTAIRKQVFDEACISDRFPSDPSLPDDVLSQENVEDVSVELDSTALVTALSRLHDDDDNGETETSDDSNRQNDESDLHLDVEHRLSFHLDGEG